MQLSQGVVSEGWWQPFTWGKNQQNWATEMGVIPPSFPPSSTLWETLADVRIKSKNCSSNTSSLACTKCLYKPTNITQTTKHLP